MAQRLLVSKVCFSAPKEVGVIATDDSDEQEERDDDGFFLGEIGNAAGKPWKEGIDVYGTKNLV